MSVNHTGPYAAIDDSFENATGTDMRLIYGLGIPFLVAVLAIVAFTLIAEVWLAFVLLALIIIGGGVVMYGISRMLRDEDGEDA